MFNINKLITDFNFANDDLIGDHYDPNNPHHCYLIIEKFEDEYNMIEFERALCKHNALTANVSKDDVKQVYISLKDRAENPRGTFDKRGRFYIVDSDIVDVRSPSHKYPYSQMNSARTAKFVKALVEKYKCQSIDELKEVAYS